MSTQQDAINYLTGAWRDSPYAVNIPAAGGLGIDTNTGGHFQCKAFANGMGIALGATLPGGNAINLAQELAPGWSWQDDPQAGDLAIRNSVLNGINYGDVLGITAVAGSAVSTIGQNQEDVSLSLGHAPTTDVHNRSEFIRFLRRNYEEEVPMPNQGDAINFIRMSKGDATYQPTQAEIDAAMGVSFKDWAYQLATPNPGDAINFIRTQKGDVTYAPTDIELANAISQSYKEWAYTFSGLVNTEFVPLNEAVYIPKS